MLQSSIAPHATDSRATQATANVLVETVRRVAVTLGCEGVWARTTGPYILLGLPRGDAFARLISLGGTSYGLAFRATSGAEKLNRPGPVGWDPILLIDELSDAVEHALVGVGVVAGSSNA